MNALFDYMTESELERAQEDAVYEYESKVFDNKLLLCEMAHQERLLKIEAEVAENCYGSDVLLGLYNKEMEYYQESVGEAISNFFSWLAEQIGKLFGNNKKAEEIANAAIQEPTEQEKLIKASEELNPGGFEVPFDPEAVLKCGDGLVTAASDMDNLLEKDKEGHWKISLVKVGLAALSGLDIADIFTNGKGLMKPTKITLEYVIKKLYKPLRNIIKGIEDICNKYKGKKGNSKKDKEEAEKAKEVQGFFSKFMNVCKTGWSIVCDKLVEAKNKVGGVKDDVVDAVLNLFTSKEEKDLVTEWRKIDQNDSQQVADFKKKLNGTKFTLDQIKEKAAKLGEKEKGKKERDQKKADDKATRDAEKNNKKSRTDAVRQMKKLKPKFTLTTIKDPASELSKYHGHYCCIAAAQKIIGCNDSSELKSSTFSIDFDGEKKKCINKINKANKNGDLIFISSETDSKLSSSGNTNESSYFDDILDGFEFINEEYEDSSSLDDLLTESTEGYEDLLEAIECL